MIGVVIAHVVVFGLVALFMHLEDRERTAREVGRVEGYFQALKRHRTEKEIER